MYLKKLMKKIACLKIYHLEEKKRKVARKIINEPKMLSNCVNPRLVTMPTLTNDSKRK